MQSYISTFVRVTTACAVFAVIAAPAQAAFITHTPGDRVPPVVVSPPFGTLAPGGAAGTNYIAFGVDYTFGGVEGVFSDPPLAFGGVNGSNVVDLLAPVDGRIVLLNTATQGLTDFVSVLAGGSAAGALLLEVFDIGGGLLGSATNPGGVSTFSVNNAGVFNIASFRVSTPVGDTFGVRQVTINDPVAAGPPVESVPVPATAMILGAGLAGLAGVGSRRRKS